MAKQTPVALRDATEALGDWHPLAEQLGAAEGLVALGAMSARLCLRPVRDRASLQRFLRRYQARILFPLELPAIEAAYGHAARNELRELVGLDQRLVGEPGLVEFAAPSRRVGRSQLRKLRPLRDQRMVQRYLHAVEAGLAHGWHTLVYGLTLEVYSLPLRQGLLGYGHQTMRGFIYAAARPLRLSEQDCRALFEELGEALPGAVAALLQSRVAA